MTLTNLVFDQPVLNSSYEYSVKHWALDEGGCPLKRQRDRTSR